jgi:transposase
MIAAYRHPDPAAGRELMVKLIESLSAGVPRPLVEIAKLGRTLSKRAADVLAYFDRPGTSNGPTEAINGRLEHLRGSALGFRNLTNYRPIPTRDRRIQTPTTPCIGEEPLFLGVGQRYDGYRQPVILS